MYYYSWTVCTLEQQEAFYKTKIIKYVHVFYTVWFGLHYHICTRLFAVALEETVQELIFKVRYTRYKNIETCFLKSCGENTFEKLCLNLQLRLWLDPQDNMH